MTRLLGPPVVSSRHVPWRLEAEPAHAAIQVGAVRGELAGRVDDTLLVINGDAILDTGAVVTGDVIVVGGTVARSPTAVVSGELRV